MSTHPSRTLLLAALLFFCSGALGLGYELIWIRKAALVVGASQIALATILTSFFLGLGLGSYVVGAGLRGRRRSPLVVYGLFEIGIGVYALAFPSLFSGVEAVYGTLYPLVADSPGGLLAIRFALLFALCLPPTFLMGGTLPLLLDGLVAKDADIGARTSFLYAINILGAVAGVLLTCYLAIPHLGMNGTSYAGGVGNLLLGGLALIAFRGSKPIHAEPSAGRPSAYYSWLGFGSGVLAIGYQIAWARYFSLLEVGTIYTTAMLLGVYLLALSAGSMLLTCLLRRGFAPLRLVATVQAVVPLAVLSCLPLWEAVSLEHKTAAMLRNGVAVPFATQQINSTWAFWSETVDTIFFDPLFRVAAVIFLPVLLIGIAVPALITAAAGSSAGLRRASGTVVFWNTLGSSSGAFLAGYALIPTIGLHGTFAVLGVGSITLAAAAWWRAGGVGLTRAVPAVAAAVALLATGWFASREDITREAILYHGVGTGLGYGKTTKHYDEERRSTLAEVVEGPLNTSYVFENNTSIQIGSGRVSLAMVDKNRVSGQAIQGHLPAIYYPGDGHPRNCLGICLGSGQSFGALLLHPIETLDVVDISASLVELSLRRFAPFNHGLERDPRVSVHLDDGRHFVERAADRSYDVISMEPPPPSADGVYALYSEEFYREVQRVLRPDGVLMQWLPLYRVSPEDGQAIVKTIAEVFPETFIVFKGNLDFMTLSYQRPPTFPRRSLEERARIFAQERGVRGFRMAEACRHPMASPESFAAMLFSGPAAVAAMATPAIYDDDRQILAYGTGDRQLLYRYRSDNRLGRMSFAVLPQSDVSSLAGYFDPPLSTEQILETEQERAAAMHLLRVPAPELVAAYRASTGGDAAERVPAILELARAQDRCLRKSQVFDLLEEALVVDSTWAVQADLNFAKKAVRSYFSVYVELLHKRIGALTRRFPEAPLVRALNEELALIQQREDERLADYLFP